MASELQGLERFKELFMPTYTPFERTFVRGEGLYLYDAEGRRYLDFCAGIATCNVGHCHPEVVAAIKDQAEKLMHVSNLYLHEVELELATFLQERTFPGRLFLCQSGAEANETAIKLARKFGRQRGGRYKIVTCLGSFHGRTLGTIAATGQDKYKAGFEPLPGGFTHVAFNDIDAITEAVDDETIAVMVEPIQGEGGVVIPDDDYLPLLRELCDEKNLLLILDEVQTGFGRTGSLFAYQHGGTKPDIISMAKAFGGGLPLGGTYARTEVAQAFSPGNHATTFGGNPVGCAAALASLKVIEKEGLAERAVLMGVKLLEGLEGLSSQFPSMITGCRGQGLMAGLDLSVDGSGIVNLCQEKKLLLSRVQEKTLRFTPPLIVGESEIEAAITILGEALLEAAQERS